MCKGETEKTKKEAGEEIIEQRTEKMKEKKYQGKKTWKWKKKRMISEEHIGKKVFFDFAGDAI